MLKASLLLRVQLDDKLFVNCFRYFRAFRDVKIFACAFVAVPFKPRILVRSARKTVLNNFKAL